jgi:DNA excision repair protein ERCC-3
LGVLDRYAKFAVPASVRIDIAETMSRYGRLVIQRSETGELELVSDSPAILLEASKHRKMADLLGGRISETAFGIQDWARGAVKQELLKLGWPAEDLAGYTPGTPHEIGLVENGWAMRGYQMTAVEKFWDGGSGVVVLPCGAGKTIVGAAAMTVAKSNTLILVTNTVSARQWKSELLKRTTLTEEEIGEYSGSVKEVRPVTIATYQILTTKRKSEYAHLALLDANDWGLIIYDEVHLLPAPIFKMTADLQARRRLGLTATLVREDGKEGDVFSLIGPKRFDAPWKEIEAQGYIAPAACAEVRVDLGDSERLDYAMSGQDERYRLAATSPIKIEVMRKLLARHRGEPTLVIGQYLDQIHTVAESLGVPFITGETPIDERERLFEAFRSGQISTLVVSKVANFSIDLPEASVAIQISGSYGSRQEEAQRLGRLLRPKADGRTAWFYTIIARDTVDQDFAQNRQRFLAEQGYSYEILDAESL